MEFNFEFGDNMNSTIDGRTEQPCSSGETELVLTAALTQGDCYFILRKLVPGGTKLVCPSCIADYESHAGSNSASDIPQCCLCRNKRHVTVVLKVICMTGYKLILGGDNGIRIASRYWDEQVMAFSRTKEAARTKLRQVRKITVREVKAAARAELAVARAELEAEFMEEVARTGMSEITIGAVNSVTMNATLAGMRSTIKVTMEAG